MQKTNARRPGRVFGTKGSPTAVCYESKQRKEPLEIASQVRNAACKRIQSAAKKYEVDLHETSWREIGKKKSG